MKSNELLENAIGKIDDDLLFDATQARMRKPRRIPYLVAAACLTMILLIIPIGILLANQTETPKVPIVDTTSSSPTTTTAITTPTPITTEKPKNSVLDIPGATLYDKNDKRLSQVADSFSGSTSPSDEELLAWAENVKKENKVVVGVIKNSTSVIVEEGEDLYRITYMDFTVLDDVSGLKQETVKVAYACRYEFSGTNFYRPATKYIADFSTDGNEKTRTIINDMAHFTESCMKDATYGRAVLLLKDAQGQSLSLSSGSLQFSDYADYVLDASFACGSSMNLAISYSLRTTLTLLFKLEWLRSVIHDSLMLTPKKEGIFFTLENSFEVFGNNPALSVTIDNGCRFYNDIFIVTNTRPKLNKTYQWAINIEGKRYEISRVWHYTYDSGTTFATPPSVTLYFDLGANFPWESFAYNENRAYTFRDVSLELYDKENNLICITNLIDLWKCNGYTHTLPETVTPIDRFSKGTDVLLGKESPSHESSPDLVLIKPINNSYFRLEDAYDGFDQRTALVLSVNREENIIFSGLFLDCDNPQVNRGYVWEILIDGITYEVEGFAFEYTDTETLVYLNLGHSFDLSRYRFDENKQYVFKDVTLGIYNPYESQVYYYYFANLGNYTHTKP